MRDLCSNIIARCGSWWGELGWCLFGSLVFLPLFCLNSPDLFPWVLLGLSLLLALWWGIDAIDQEVAVWQVLLGLTMLAIGFLPRGGLLTLACWVIYWQKVRE